MLIGDSTTIDLRLGDCVDGMRQLEAASIDLVFADPPFNIGKPYGGARRNDQRADYYEWQPLLLNRPFIVAKPRLRNQG